MESPLLHGLLAATSVWKSFQLGIRRCGHYWNYSRNLMTLLRQVQRFFTIFPSTSSPDNALELARLVSVVHRILMANLMEPSRQDGQWQGIVLTFEPNLAILIGLTELIDPRFIAMHTHRRHSILRRNSDQPNQSRRIEVKYYHHSTNCELVRWALSLITDITSPLSLNF